MLPITRLEDDRDYSCFTGLVTLYCPFHLNVVAIIRVDKIGTDKQQDDTGRVQVLIDLPFPFSSRTDFAIMPFRDYVLAFQHGKVFFKPLALLFILM